MNRHTHTFLNGIWIKTLSAPCAHTPDSVIQFKWSLNSMGEIKKKWKNVIAPKRGSIDRAFMVLCFWYIKILCEFKNFGREIIRIIIALTDPVAYGIEVGDHMKMHLLESIRLITFEFSHLQYIHTNTGARERICDCIQRSRNQRTNERYINMNKKCVFLPAHVRIHFE